MIYAYTWVYKYINMVRKLLSTGVSRWHQQLISEGLGPEWSLNYLRFTIVNYLAL